MSNNENIDDVGAGAEDGGGTTRRKVNFIIDMLNLKLYGKMSILGYTWSF